MSKRHNKHWIKAYLDIVTNKTEAPEKFHFWVACVVLGGVLRRKVRINQGHYSWYPNWFVVLVAPPGISTKSTTIDLGLGLLRDVPTIQFGPDISSWQELLQTVQESREDVALSEMTFQPMSAITMGISELGNFLDPKDYNMINTLTDLWDCRDVPLVKKTKTQGDNVIINPFVNFVAGTTPKWLADNFKGYFGGWGLSSRIVMLHSNTKSKVIAYPSKLWGDGGFERHAQEAHLLDDLIHIRDNLCGDYLLTPDAMEFGEQWYHDHYARMVEFSKNPLADPWVQYYFARKQGHVHKLAMVLAASQRDELIVTRHDLEVAVDRCDEVENEMLHIFGQGSPDKGSAAAHDILLMIHDLASKGIKASETDIYRHTIRSMDGGTAKNALEYLISAHLVTKVAGMDPQGRPCSFLIPVMVEQSQPPPPSPIQQMIDELNVTEGIG